MSAALVQAAGPAVISNICVKNKSTNRAKILQYEKIAKTLPQVEIPIPQF